MYMSKPHSRDEFIEQAGEAVTNQTRLATYLGTQSHTVDTVVHNQSLAMDARLQLRNQLEKLVLRVLELESKLCDE